MSLRKTFEDPFCARISSLFSGALVSEIYLANKYEQGLSLGKIAGG